MEKRNLCFANKNLDQLHCARKDDGTLAWNIDEFQAANRKQRFQTKENAFKLPSFNLNRSTRNCRRMGPTKEEQVFVAGFFFR